MTIHGEPFNKSKSGEGTIPQFSLPKILLMYAWPVAWFLFLIYVVGPAFVRPDGTYPLWAYNLIGVLGNGAELIAALLIFRREGHRLTPKALRERINPRFPGICSLCPVCGLLEYVGLEILSADVYHRNLAISVARE